MGLTRKITFRKAIPYALVKEVPEFLPSCGPTALAVRPEDFAALNEALQTHPARAPAATEFSCSGWVEPITHPKPIDREDPTLLEEKEEPSLVYPLSKHLLLIALEESERILPPKVIRRELDKRIAEIESSQLRKVYKKERDQIKDDITQGLLPRAFVKSERIRAMIDTQRNLIWVEAGRTKAERLLSLLREALGSLAVRVPTVRIAPSATMTEWVREQQVSVDLSIMDCAIYQDPDRDGKATLVRQDLSAQPSQDLLCEGKIVTRLNLNFQNSVYFTFDEDMSFKAMLFDGAEFDGAEETEDAEAMTHAIMYLQGKLLGQMFDHLTEQLGGLDMGSTI